MAVRRLLVAPDSFKGTFTAVEVAQALAAGATAAGWVADVCPVADGGEGTTDVLARADGGSIVCTRASDPRGRAIDARLALLDGGRVAVVEVAAASGLTLIAPDERDAEAASTAGTGELIVAAVRAGARHVMVAVGGSATTDGGAGAIEAIEQAGGLAGATLEVLCDTRVPFEDAARVFGPQKGADPDAVQRLTARLRALAAGWVRDPRGVPMTGCAGGLSGGLWSAYGARLVSGASAVLAAVGFDQRLADADAVVTGEGQIDGQSLTGKIVGEIAARAQAAVVPVHAVVGSDALTADGRRRFRLTSVTVATTLDQIAAAAHGL